MQGLPSILYRWGSGWLQSSFKIANLFYKMDGAQSRMPEILCSYDVTWEWPWFRVKAVDLLLHQLALPGLWGDLLGADTWSVWMCLFHGRCESYHMRDMGTVETNPQGKEGIGSPCYGPKMTWSSLFWLDYSTHPGSCELCILFIKSIFPKVNLDWLIWSWWSVVEY